MVIHVVQPGETTNEIAAKYGISEEWLIVGNMIRNPNNLAIGEALVILFPEVTHVVQEGDTLSEIANSYGISLLQLLRNNPYVTSRKFIYPGETLVIRYQDEKIGRISTFGYANPYINTDVLNMTLPFLTYITVYSYTFTDQGMIKEIDDEFILRQSKEFQVTPIMMLDPEDGNQNGESYTLQNLLMNREGQERFFSNVLDIIKRKGYYGVNVNVPYILPQYREDYVDFMIRFSGFLKNEGCQVVFNTLSLTTFEIMTEIIYKGFDYSRLVQHIDGLYLMTYEWGNNIGIPTGIISFENIRNYVRDMIKIFPANKMNIGIPVLGYIWELPFVLGVSRGYAITSNAASELAAIVGAEIQFDDVSKIAYFQYLMDREFNVRFRDARSIMDYLNLVNEFGLNGISIWNIMQLYPQLGLIVNALYDIDRLYVTNNPENPLP